MRNWPSSHLTEGEGKLIVHARSLDTARDRIFAAAQARLLEEKPGSYTELKQSTGVDVAEAYGLPEANLDSYRE